MQLDHFSKQLAALESQKNNIEQKIAAINKRLKNCHLSPGQIKLHFFRKLFISNELVYAKHWVSR